MSGIESMLSLRLFSKSTSTPSRPVTPTVLFACRHGKALTRLACRDSQLGYPSCSPMPFYQIYQLPVQRLIGHLSIYTCIQKYWHARLQNLLPEPLILKRPQYAAKKLNNSKQLEQEIKSSKSHKHNLSAVPFLTAFALATQLGRNSRMNACSCRICCQHYSSGQAKCSGLC